MINFAGGWTGQRCDAGGRGFNQATFASAGGRIRIPMLWLYAEEDGCESLLTIGRIRPRWWRPASSAPG